MSAAFIEIGGDDHQVAFLVPIYYSATMQGRLLGLGGKAGLAFRLRPAGERCRLAAIVEERHAEAAGGLHEVDRQRHDLPRTERLVISEFGGEEIPIVAAAAAQGSPLAVEAQDHGWTL